MTRQDKGHDRGSGTGHDRGQDFASATMMRLVAAGLARQGISAPAPQASGARVPIAHKRHVLDAVMEAHGPLAILSIADAARNMPPEPVVQALTRARDIDDLFDRWRRLERFSHGRHRVEVRRLDNGTFRLTHQARDGGPPPSPPESLLVLGLLTILAEMIGGGEASLATEAGDIWRDRGAWHAPDPGAATRGLVLSPPHRPKATGTIAASASADPVLDLRRNLAADPARRWTLADLAAEAGASPRTLQRRLAIRSVSFTRLVSDARLEVAASYLSDTGGPGLAEIGFLAGFSDQAHFARVFNRSVGTTPGAYRADFARPQGQPG
ncbi:MAG: helix-turn-helix transcriptional regulator [Hoeflea sp.]|uniref:helix-turn-helix transcriptional regulator n=1 Tax=Hoeflea sp. TaxID=1940281 RepID=UPI0027304556|nr:helix-turn-helix transcriptional regulator [Hoeflea sp.]MDP2120348.1 helix-turn-helix transcriptional regulator [Hoeflea sp.]